ncbi:MAG TPA: STAS domain-containing protein [Solirubrobacteraceae bacterium]|jgi:anti-anti-sigma factor|nr:STAS domain-containing protein [Solirubrobacteraceae bacterium]
MPAYPEQRKVDLPISGRLEVRRSRRGAAQIIELAGELDLATAGELALAIKAASVRGAAIIVLDLRRLEFIDSSGIHVIVEAWARLRARLTVVKGPPRVHRVFELCGLVGRLAFAEAPADRDHDARAQAAPWERPRSDPAPHAHRVSGGSGRNRRASQAALAAAVRELRSPSGDLGGYWRAETHPPAGGGSLAATDPRTGVTGQL